MIDVIMYNDGLMLTPNMYIDTIDRNKLLLDQFKDQEGVRIIFYSLTTSEDNYMFMSYLETYGYGYDLIIAPNVVLHDELMFEAGKTLEARGLWNLIYAIKAKKVVFIRTPTQISSLEPLKIDYKDTNDFDLTGTVVDGAKFKMLMHDLSYTGYLTSDMVFFLLATVPGYCDEKRYETIKIPKPHHIASLVDFYDHITTTLAPYRKTVDRRDLLQELKNNQF